MLSFDASDALMRKTVSLNWIWENKQTISRWNQISAAVLTYDAVRLLEVLSDGESRYPLDGVAGILPARLVDALEDASAAAEILPPVIRVLWVARLSRRLCVIVDQGSRWDGLDEDRSHQDEGKDFGNCKEIRGMSMERHDKFPRTQ